MEEGCTSKTRLASEMLPVSTTQLKYSKRLSELIKVSQDLGISDLYIKFRAKR
jgi:hypothetical protein